MLCHYAVDTNEVKHIHFCNAVTFDCICNPDIVRNGKFCIDFLHMQILFSLERL